MNTSNKMKLKTISDRIEILKTGLKEIRNEEIEQWDKIYGEKDNLPSEEIERAANIEKLIDMLQESITTIDTLQSNLANIIDYKNTTS